MERKQNWQHIEQLLNENGITKLYHFTDKRNIESIIRNGGLYSWGDCVDHNIKVQVPGGSEESHSLDYYKKQQYYVRLSFVKNHPMKFIAMSDERQLQPVILEISPEVLFWKHTKFTDQNAVKTGANISGDPNDFSKLIHFDAIKATNVYDLSEEDRSYFQAEILVHHCLPLCYILNLDEIKRMHFPNWDFCSLPVSEQISITQRRAELNDPISQYVLGRRYQRGDGVKKDFDLAINWYFKSASSGFIKSFYALGHLYKDKEDINNALYWFKRSIDNGDTRAYSSIAFIYLQKNATQNAIEEGYRMLHKGAECGNVACAFLLGIEYISGNTWGEGNIISIDKNKGIELIRKAADNGLLKAQKYLGDYYRKESNEWAALKYYRLAAEQGDSDSLFYAGLYSKRRGHNEDAVKYYKMAIEQNDIEAMNNLAICYEYGQGVEKDEEEAFKLYKRAAEAGDDVAQNNLGNCYEKGTGTIADFSQSLIWRKKAAKNKNLAATRKLARIYFEGIDIEKDIVTATHWYIQLAEIGTPKDIYDTSQFFKEIGDENNYQNYLSLAAEKDYTKALIDLEKYDKISTAQKFSHYDYDKEGIKYSSDSLYVLECDYKTKVVDINDKTIIIADEAFKYCEHLTRILIPKSVKVIGKRSFVACDKLTSIICESDKFIIQNGCLLSVDKKRLITYFGNTENVIIPEGVTTIDEGAFLRKNIKTVVLPKSLRVIGDGAFACCFKLSMVYMQNNVEEIGKHAFEECKKLKMITLSSKLRHISQYAFRFSGLEELILPDNIIEVDDFAFYGCEKLKIADMGNGIQKLGDSAFQNCNELINIRLSDRLESIGSFAIITAQNILTSNNNHYFTDSHALYRNTSEGIYLCRYFAADNLIDIKLPIIGVDDFAFYNIPAEQILLPPSVKKIGRFCFAKCNRLDHITLPEELTSIPQGIFEECLNLRHVIISKNVKNIDSESSLGYSKHITRHCVFLNDNVELSYAKLEKYNSIPLGDNGGDTYEETISGRLPGCSTGLIGAFNEAYSPPKLNVVLHIHSNTKGRINEDLLDKVKDIMEFDE